jgi:hypothetical protein
MTKLTEDQLAFLERYGVSASDVFDATGLPTAVWKVLAKAQGKRFAFGTTPCEKKRHTIRTRGGHCFQCNPENKSYITRHEVEGYVYIAQSKATSLVKVGMTTDLEERGRQLNVYRYGGARDWRIVATAWVGRAGKIESNTQAALRDCVVFANYTKAGVSIDCRELFKTDLKTAKIALARQLPKGTTIKDL